MKDEEDCSERREYSGFKLVGPKSGGKYDRWKGSRRRMEKNFRLPRERFVELAEELRPYISPNPLSPNYRALSTEKKLAVTLYYLKDTGSLAMTANTFSIAVSTASVIIGEVCKAITKNLGPKYVYMPFQSVIPGCYLVPN